MPRPPNALKQGVNHRGCRISWPKSAIAGPSAACANCPFRGHCLPKGLEWLQSEDRQQLIALPRVVHRGEVLYRAGQELEALYVVRAGSLKITIASPEGHEQVVRFHLAGDLVGADGLEQAIIGSNATALETTGLCELPAYQFNTLSRRFATVQHRLLKHLASQLSNAQAMLLVVGKRSAEERVATFLISLMQRLEARGFSGKELNLSMTRYDIASYLGLAVETISRAFKALQTDGLISVRARHIRLNDASKLQVLAGGRPELADCDVFSSTQRCLG